MGEKKKTQFSLTGMQVGVRFTSHMETKTCKHCKVEFSKPYGLCHKAWSTRKYCSRRCKDLAVTIPIRKCKACGHEFKPPQRTSVVCSMKCSGKLTGDRLRKTDGQCKRHTYRARLVGGHSRLEHRIVMEAMIGRPLARHETVHHKNGNRKDNRPENLELWSTSHCAGQRVLDVIDYILENHGGLLTIRMAQRNQPLLGDGPWFTEYEQNVLQQNDHPREHLQQAGGPVYAEGHCSDGPEHCGERAI